MLRAAPWIGAAICVCLGAGFWLFRSRAGRVLAPDPADTVRRAWAGSRNVPLEGREIVLIPERGLRVEARVLQSSRGDLRIDYLTGTLRGGTLWEAGGRTYRYTPKSRRLTIAHGRDTEADRRSQEIELLRNYTVRLTGTARVAGRSAIVAELRSRSDPTRWRRIWIDPGRWFVLATEEYRGQGATIIRSSRFIEVNYLDSDPDSSRFRPPQNLIRELAAARPGDSSSRFTAEELSAQLGYAVRLPRRLPAGYRYDGGYLMPCGCGMRHQAARLEFTDGLSTITLFECGQRACESPGRCFGWNPQDTMTAIRRVDGYSYLVVGDLNHRELEQVLDHMGPG